jgi:hypothetical protein
MDEVQKPSDSEWLEGILLASCLVVALKIPFEFTTLACL